jgi:hypothetical protein
MQYKDTIYTRWCSEENNFLNPAELLMGLLTEQQEIGSK